MVKNLPFVMIAFAAAMWGLIGFFVKGLSDVGFSAMEIVAIRAVTATIFLMAAGVLLYPQKLKVSFKDFYLFIGTGIFSIVFFNWCYFTAISLMNIPIAVSLLYTSPAFVAILSFVFLKETFTMNKVLAIGLTVAGCSFTAGMIGSTGSSFGGESILIGLGAGFGYALYSIIGKVALRKYDPFTVTMYTFIVASAALIPTTGIVGKGDMLIDGRTLLLAAGLGLFPTVLAYFAYSWGLERVESSTASIVATLEPVVATMLGFFVYHDRLTVFQLIGSMLIIFSVIAVNATWPIRSQKSTSL